MLRLLVEFPPLDAAVDWIFGAAADCGPKGGRFWPTVEFIWVISLLFPDYCAHLGAFKLKIDWLGNKLWIFEEKKVLKFHQKAEHPLVWIISIIKHDI